MPRNALRGVTVLLMSACGGCAGLGSSVDYSLVLQDRYDLQPCPELIKTQESLRGREKDLLERIRKAEASFGGAVVSTVAYRSELAQTQAQIRFADQSAREKSCGAPPVRPLPAPPQPR